MFHVWYEPGFSEICAGTTATGHRTKNNMLCEKTRRRMSPWPHKTGPFLKLFLIFDSFPIIYSPSCCAKEISNKGRVISNRQLQSTKGKRSQSNILALHFPRIDRNHGSMINDTIHETQHQHSVQRQLEQLSQNWKCFDFLQTE